MAEREGPSIMRQADAGRSSEDIRQDIVKEKENISQTVEEIGERIKDKMDWRGYVTDAPYWALGAAAGLGYLASRMLTKRTTPLERIMRPIADEVRDSVGNLIAGAAGSGIIKVTLMAIATKAVANWIRQATSTDGASGGAEPHPQAVNGSTTTSKIDA